MSEVFFLVEESEEGGFTARALGQSIFTEADDIQGLRENIKDAVQVHFEPDQIQKVSQVISQSSNSFSVRIFQQDNP